ncbi:JAB domain-containing protein [Pedobacter flavus]|uniref:JAB domain-containing protein n=1 Tax=Pedobacter flavus TaxID=3113906 RepID=A0ABU7GZC8_9SPHI|nr:JAB domain-containing protein [Pedobacter sp. VNH31]MEE1884382.1 JAB domain-containing protein [Pedobacter sp. VNH31]
MEQNLFKVAEVKISYKQHFKISERPKISKSQDAYSVLLNGWNLETISLYEEFKLLLLNRSNRVLGIVNLSVGGITGTVVDPRLIFVCALKANACNLILAHNHPSGALTPSEEDIKLTSKISNAAKLLEITVFDHLIVTDNGYYSFADNGLL